MSPGMFAEHERICRHADGFRRHDLIAERIVNHAMLVNARFVRKRVAADNSLVWLHFKSDDAREQLTGGIKLLGSDARVKRQTIGAHVQRHHDLFERCIPGAFADTVDGALNLPRACFERGESVCHRESEIVVTMHADDHVSISDDALFHLLDEARKLHRLAAKGMSLKAISKALTRSEESIQTRAKQDGLKVSKLR